ncbi:unnamed protein product [Adineta steineri]|uniref:long-chain-fatty-acid--CoA ligase n=1 Tax=Adineta steineri TaxID=433720 RepID=A0A814F5J2_9BILA|nr:unnamed protein product [Adineta steineri]CAF1123721.1 unnamed protein product [Adineta steineri]
MVREIAYGYVEAVECAGEDLAARIHVAINTYQDRFCMGTRDINPNNSQHYTDSYSWQTFKTIGERIINFSHGLRRLIKPRDYIGICAANRPEWLITDFASILQSFVSVPIYRLFTDHEISFIINNTLISVMVCDKEMLPRLIQLHTECPSLRHIVCMDSIPLTMPKTNDLSIHEMNAIERYGSIKRHEYVQTKPDECITIIYTSGSSGFPKGAMISEKAFRSNFPQPNLSFRNEPVKLCYRPLSWATDRQSSIGVFLAGGRIAFSTGDVTHLMEEVSLVRPTSFSGPPTIWNKIYSEYKTTLALMTIDQSNADIIATIEETLLQQFAKLIPIRCKLIAVGGSMMSPVVFDFMKRCFRHCEIMESYGTTESGGITYDNLLEMNINYRLESVIEMGYTLDDKPFPRGELLVKTSTMFSGYINNSDETKMALTDNGFFRTGDIVELHCMDDGQINIRIIDRKKNFFKLSQGQFVSPEFLEGIYRQSPFVEQIYIHGHPLEDSVVAVIVPNKEYTRLFEIKHNLTELNDTIMEDLRSLATKESLRKYEIPSRLIIDFEPFTSANGLLTSSMKLCRYRLAAHYNDRLKMTESIENRLQNLIERAIEHRLSIDQTMNLISIGGDSLAMVRLSRMIYDDLGISIPLNILFQSNMTIENLANIIKNPSEICSFSDSIITQLLNDSAEQFNIKIDKQAKTTNSPSAIFITGAAGFVGGFLLAELLKIYPTDCQLICLVRCDTMINPLDRIRENLTFLLLWSKEFEDRIVALRGDLAEQYFGLDYEIYCKLANQIDIIYHCGASVNFILPYNKLYKSNVYGTGEIIRFATYNDRCIPVHYISTMSVLPLGMIDEIHIDEISPHHLKSGYAQSKWVAEKLIANANRSGLPVIIYRLGSIWGDTETGACNQNDIYTLLLAAIMKIGCYPTTSTDIRLNGLPVNLAVQTIVSLSRNQSNLNGKIYHIIPSDEGISFQNIIETIQHCNVTVDNVSYDQWKIQLMKQSTKKHSFESIGELFSNNPFEQITSIKSATDHVFQLTFASIDQVYIMKWLKFILNNIVYQNVSSSSDNNFPVLFYTE